MKKLAFQTRIVRTPKETVETGTTESKFSVSPEDLMRVTRNVAVAAAIFYASKKSVDTLAQIAVNRLSK